MTKRTLISECDTSPECLPALLTLCPWGPMHPPGPGHVAFLLKSPHTHPQPNMESELPTAPPSYAGGTSRLTLLHTPLWRKTPHVLATLEPLSSVPRSWCLIHSYSWEPGRSLHALAPADAAVRGSPPSALFRSMMVCSAAQVTCDKRWQTRKMTSSYLAKNKARTSSGDP